MGATRRSRRATKTAAPAAPPPDAVATPVSRRYWLIVAGMTLAAAAAVWIIPAGRLIAGPKSDMVGQFYAWRAFAAEVLLSGHLPLWNPWTYSGEPFLGGFQSAVFYPPNWIFLIGPLDRALNLSLLLHLFWMGVGMDHLARRRGFHPAATAVAGLLLPLSGAVFPHVYAGHLVNVCTMSWAPWLFWGLEEWWHDGRARGWLLAAVSAAMQVLSGHVQYAFYTAVAAGLFALVHTIFTPALRRRALLSVAALYVLAAALTAVQLLPGWAAATEGLHGTLDFDYVSTFSFPPENLLTLIAPVALGGLSASSSHQIYWGRWYLWEVNVFVGAAGLLLAWIALTDRLPRRARLDLLVSGLLVLLAFGASTPLLRLLYDTVPGFGSFRGLAKFTFPALLFLALTVAAGADALIAGRWPRRSVLGTSAILGLGLTGAGLWWLLSPGHVAGFLDWVRQTGGSYLPDETFADPGFVRAAGLQAGRSLLIGGLALLGVTAIVHFAPRWLPLRWAPLVLLPIELLLFAQPYVVTASATDTTPARVRAFLREHPGDYRILDLLAKDNGFLVGASDVSGNDPAVLKRYAEFVTFAHGGDPDRATQYLHFDALTRLDALIRLRYAFGPAADGMKVIENTQATPLPHALLVSGYLVLQERDAIFEVMKRDDFDPRQTVVLEEAPSPRPEPGATPGTVRVVGETANTIDLDAETAAPAIMLITDAYSRDWRAVSLGSGPQAHYDVLPADYALRAVPLAAGHHRIRLEYAPRSLTIGAVVSLLAWLAFAGLWWRSGRLRGRLRASSR